LNGAGGINAWEPLQQVFLPTSLHASDSYFFRGYPAFRKRVACDCRKWRKTANEEQVIGLHSIGFDALTTDLPSLDAFAERYRHLKINLVFAVPDQFPRLDLFPHETNGVRYGQIRLFELYAYRKHDLPSEMAACVEELLEAVTLRKEHVAHAVNLQELTRGRANFRISPDTETDSGVPAAQENKKEGWANPGAPRANRRKHRKQPDLKRRRVVEDGEEHVEV